MGHKVVGLDNLSTGDEHRIPAAVELMQGDIRCIETVTKALTGVDGCFHLAAIASVAVSEDNPIYAHEVNAKGTLNIFQAAQYQQKNIPIVYASSAAVYGHRQNDECGAPSTKISPISIYGSDKAVNEFHAQSFWLTKKQPSCGLRFFNVYGTGQNQNSMYSGVITAFVKQLIEGNALNIYGDGSQTRDFIHVSDVAQYMIYAMSTLRSGADVYDICSGHATSINHLAKALLEIANKEAAIIHKSPKRHDILHSIGNPLPAMKTFKYDTQISLEQGLREIWHEMINRQDH